MVSIEEAKRIILHHSFPLPTEEVPLLKALGRVTAEDVIALRDIPPADNSAMDGYAFSFTSFRGDCLPICGFLPAGGEQTEAVPAGEAIKIMTGAPLPPGCDTVVPVEDTEALDGAIRIKGDIKTGSHIRAQGEDVRRGAVAVPAGVTIRPQEIGMLCALGKCSVRVYRKAQVAILATGDELLAAGSQPVAGKIFNSNSYSLAAQVIEAGGEPVLLGIARDNLRETRAQIVAGLDADVLITTGGVSVGDRDFVKEALVELGGDMKFWKVAMKPGKPVAFAMLRGIPVFALPGNPVAAMVSFEQLVRPALLKSMGHERIFRPNVKAALKEALKNRGNRLHLVGGCVELAEGRYYVNSTGNQSSGRLSSLTLANGLIVMPSEAAFTPGELVDVQLLDRDFECERELYSK